MEPTSHGITFSLHDVLEASHTRKTSPLLAGYCTKLLPHRANQLPDKEFRYLRTVHCCYSIQSIFVGELGRHISDRLSWSPTRSDYLIPPCSLARSAYS